MAKIDKFTPEQEALIDVYLKDGLKFGLQTQHEDYDDSIMRPLIDKLYESINLPPPVVFYTDSPHAAMRIISAVKGFQNKLSSNGSYEFYGDFKSKFLSIFGSEFPDKSFEFCSNYVPGAQSNFWLKFYQFINEELPIDNKFTDPLFKSMIKICERIGWFFPYEKVVFVAKHPTRIHMVDGVLHNPNGPAIEFIDGFKVYSIKGIRFDYKMAENFIEKTPDEIDPKSVLSIENTEQRYAVMEKVGKAKFLKALNAKLLDKDGDCALYYLTIEETEIGPYLYMKCPSTGHEFLEGVGDATKYENIDPTIKTCADAHKWRIEQARGKLDVEPIARQGDVYIFDRNKKAKVLNLKSILKET